MSGFEGFEGQTELGNGRFWARKGVDETPAPGNGSLPPGAMETPGFPTANKTTAKTTDSFIRDTAA
jgi:hypothetical protein